MVTIYLARAPKLATSATGKLGKVLHREAPVLFIRASAQFGAVLKPGLPLTTGPIASFYPARGECKKLEGNVG